MDTQSGGLWDGAEVISRYTREQAIEDGVLVDVSEWASADKGFHGGFTCPVVMTRALWNVVDIDARGTKSLQSMRGRAHDVVWMASLALRQALVKNRDRATFRLLLTNGRKKTALLHAVADDDGVTVGFPGDF